MTKHETQVWTLGQRQRRTRKPQQPTLLAGEETKIKRRYQADCHQSARHLIHQHRTAAHARTDLLVADGIERTHGRRDHADGNTRAMTGIEREDAHHAHHRDECKTKFNPRETFLEQKWFEKCRKEADERETHHADRHIRRLDGAIEQYPVESQYSHRV